MFLEETRQIWHYRELLFSLVVKELKLRYRYTVLGFGWAFLSPLLFGLTLWFILGHVFQPDIPRYPLFLLSGLFPWFFFQSTLTESTGAILYHSNLIKHVQFPRVLLPIALVVSKLAHLLVSLGLFVLFVQLSSHPINLKIVWLVPVLLVQSLLILGLGFAISALNCFFRDVRYLLEFFLILLFYGSPILYSMENLEGLGGSFAMRLYRTNPLIGIFSAYQNILVYGKPPHWDLFIWSVVASAILCALGVSLFKRYEPFFADIV